MNANQTPEKNQNSTSNVNENSENKNSKKRDSRVSNARLKLVCISAMFCAVIAATIACLPKIPIVGGSGFVHIGDSFVYLASALLPLPYSLLACAIGGGLSDLLCGYAVYAPASFVIKGVTALVFRSVLTRRAVVAIDSKGNAVKFVNLRNCLALIPAALICAGGYFTYECILYGFATAIVGVPMNFLQSAVGSVIYVALGLALDKSGVISKLTKGSGM